MATNSVKVKLGYVDDSKRQYTFTNVSDAAIIPTNIKAAIRAFNAMDDGGKAFFVSEGGASLKAIEEVITESVQETKIPGV